MAIPTLAIPQDVIEPIIQANITAAIANAMGPRAQVMEKAIATILATRVDDKGVPTTSTYNSHATWLDWAISNAIREAAKAAIAEQVDLLQEAIKTQLAKELTKKNSPMVKQIADGLVGGAFNPDALRYRLNVTADTRS